MVETLVSDIPDDLQESIFQVLDRACELERTLATAESCTGGLVASLFTDVEGSSHAFERGYVVYTNAGKTDMLGVPEDRPADSPPPSLPREVRPHPHPISGGRTPRQRSAYARSERRPTSCIGRNTVTYRRAIR